jgi:addiction module HigA family antidote
MKKTAKLPPTHPGEILLRDFLEPLGLSQYALAKVLGVTPIRVSQIVRGQRAVTADTALRLARYFGTRADWWLDLQTHHDLELAHEAHKVLTPLA